MAPTSSSFCLISIYGRCKPSINPDTLLYSVKQLTMCLMGFHQQNESPNYTLELKFCNKISAPGVFGCDLQVCYEKDFDPAKYCRQLDSWLNDQMRNQLGFLSVTCECVEYPRAAVTAAATAAPSSSSPVVLPVPPRMSHFKLGKCLEVTCRTHNEQPFSDELQNDVIKLLSAFFESESKGGYKDLYAAAFVDRMRTCVGVLCFSVFVGCEPLGGSEEAASQRLWAMCYRLSDWMNVQLFAKYPEYNVTSCTPVPNDLKRTA